MARRIPDRARLDAWRELLRAHSRVMRVLERDLKRDFGLTAAQYDVLVHLSEADGQRLRMSDLAQALLYSSGAATKLLDPMVRAGYVRREAAQGDRRTVHAVLTPAGLDLFGRAGRRHLVGIQREFGVHLDDEEVEVVRGALRRVADPPGIGDPGPQPKGRSRLSGSTSSRSS